MEANIVSVSIEDCDHLIIDNIDSDQTVAQFDNWHVWDSDDLTLRNSTFEGGEDGIDFNTDITNALIEKNTFKNITTGSGAATDLGVTDDRDGNTRPLPAGSDPDMGAYEHAPPPDAAGPTSVPMLPMWALIGLTGLIIGLVGLARRAPSTQSES